MRRKALLAAVLVGIAVLGAWFVLPRTGRISVTPPAANPPGPLPEPPGSTIEIPLAVSMEDLRTLARTRLPEEISGASPVRESLFDGRGSYVVKKDGDPDVKAEDGRLVLSVPVRFHARLNGTGTALGISVPVSLAAEGALTIELSMKPSISPDWKVLTQPRILLKWRQAPGTRVLGVRVTFQGAAEEFLRSRIEEALPRIDAVLNDSIRLREKAEKEWVDLQEPTRLSTSPDLWLHVRPTSVSLPPLDIEPDRVSLDTRIDTQLALDTKKPRNSETTPLPMVSGTGGKTKTGGFSLQLPILLDYGALDTKLNADLAGRRLEMGEGRSLTIEKIAVSGNGKRLVLALDIRALEGMGLLSRHRAGTIYVSGVPVWDRFRQEIRLEQVDFDEGTTQGLLRTAAWIGRPILLERLGKAAVFPLAKAAGDARIALGRVLKNQQVGSGLSFSGSARQVALESVAVTEKGLALLVRAEGTAALEWRPNAP